MAEEAKHSNAPMETSLMAVQAFDTCAHEIRRLRRFERKRLLLALVALFDVDFGPDLDEETALGALDLETAPAPKDEEFAS